jgi:probable HAF family extracellular repeat protein
MKDLGTLGGVLGVTNWLNSSGEVVGTSDLTGDANFHAFLWSRGSLMDLRTLGGNNSEAFWISDSGLVVGRADFSVQSTNHHAFLWKNGVMTDLGTLGPCLNSTAYSVNSNGQVVGDTGDCPGGGGGPSFFSEHGEHIVDINTLVLPGSDLEVVDLFDINDRGEIAGRAVLPNGDEHAVLLVPASADEIAAANAFNLSQPMSTHVHRFVKNFENSSGRNRVLKMLRQTRGMP